MSEDPPIETRAEDGAIVDGNWRWFTNCPDNLIRISAPWSNILMHKFNSDSPITRFTFNFFDRHTAFKHLAQEVGETHSLSPGEVAFLVVGYCHSLIGVLNGNTQSPS